MEGSTNENNFSHTDYFPRLPRKQSFCGFQKQNIEDWKKQVSGLSPKEAAL
jgi:hypothetical protein